MQVYYREQEDGALREAQLVLSGGKWGPEARRWWFSRSVVSDSLPPRGLPGSPALRRPPELAQTRAHRISEAIRPSRSLSPLLLPAALVSGPFLTSWLFTTGGQNTEASAAASVLPINIQA